MQSDSYGKDGASLSSLLYIEEVTWGSNNLQGVGLRLLTGLLEGFEEKNESDKEE